MLVIKNAAFLPGFGMKKGRKRSILKFPKASIREFVYGIDMLKSSFDGAFLRWFDPVMGPLLESLSIPKKMLVSGPDDMKRIINPLLNSLNLLDILVILLIVIFLAIL